MPNGYLAVVLHAHLPYIHHTDEEHVLEERWFFEALTECYLPLLEVFDGLQADGIGYEITLSVSVPLLTMLTSPVLQGRYIQYLDNLIGLAESEMSRTSGSEAFGLAAMYHQMFLRHRERYCHQYQCDLISPLRSLMEAGNLEIITCAGTHGYLPLMLTEEAVRAQVGSAVEEFASLFGRRPKGLWLPECGYRPDLDAILREFGIEYFVLDTHGIAEATPQPPAGDYNPVTTSHGLAALGRDKESALQVWSSKSGYPGDYDYREYYRDIGWDLPYDYLKPYVHPGGFRHNTGIKYHRITGQGTYRDWYDPEAADRKAGLQAGHFVESRRRQIRDLA
ncbi:MAG TPA: DUF1957 domain-containing protein, partial [Bacillota bacterium]|nr:DUF1957 domain-containing protein [Bacillota bacterium]